MTQVICVVCPKGCHLTVDEQNGFKVSGNQCVRGDEYGRAELQNPTRVLTSTVRVVGGGHPRCPVKTSSVIPKKLIIPAVRLLDDILLEAPVSVGQVIIEDVCGTGVSIVATRDIPANAAV